MDDAELFEVTQRWKKLNGKPSDQVVFEALIVVLFDELIKVDAIEIKDNTKVVSPNKVILQLDNSLHILLVILFQQQ